MTNDRHEKHLEMKVVVSWQEGNGRREIHKWNV